MIDTSNLPLYLVTYVDGGNNLHGVKVQANDEAEATKLAAERMRMICTLKGWDDTEFELACVEKENE